MESKKSYDKHAKYVEFYKDQVKVDEEYWGLGIENESYLMFAGLDTVARGFLQENRLPERYSLDYWKNFKYAVVNTTLARLPRKIKVPIYVNSYGFQNTDLLGEHITIYTKERKRVENPLYSGQTIDEYLKRVSPDYVKFLDKNLIYDGDTFEFTTFNFYKTTVTSVIDELTTIKATVLAEMNKRLVSKFTIFKTPLIFPPFNYGFVKFQTNKENIAVCNNGTYHINLTLPTKLTKEGKIQNENEFKAQHANAIRAIQWIEPILVALYGSPDILHMLNSSYAGGSLRLAMSRYISLGTYDSATMEKGKLLDTCVPTAHFTNMHEASPYIPPHTIGYDFNYNKFTKHGIELRIFDYFPEKYLESVINLILLVCQHSILNPVPDPRGSSLWNDLCIKAIMKGSSTKVTSEMFSLIYSVFGVKEVKSCWWPFEITRPIKRVADILSEHLYAKYSKGPLCTKMSPNMKPICIVDYNSAIKLEYKKTFL